MSIEEAIDNAREALQEYEMALLAMGDALYKIADVIGGLPNAHELIEKIQNDLDPDQAPIGTIDDFLDDLETSIENNDK